MTDPPAFGDQTREMTFSGPGLEEMLRAVLAKKAAFRFKAAGVSMSPFIKNGDVLTISPLGPAPPGFGEIVAFMHPATKKIAVHRLVGRQGGRFKVKGDNTRTPGVLLGLNDILGRITGIERNGRSISWSAGPARRLIGCLSRCGVAPLVAGCLQRLRPSPREEAPDE